MSIKPLQQAGDTIVEVLMVVVVLGVVVTSGYQIAVISLQSMQLAQERTYALKMAEGQVENLKAKALENPAILARTNGFCIDETATERDFGINGSPTTTMNAENYNNYPNQCRKDPNAGACTGICYYYGIRKVTDNAFTASVRWDGPRGNKQQVELSYRVYP